ncbi:Os03g0760401 [Oryza sativa Japonica Group]|uniref:Os03g0760401 protein n=1 Tax=Oryza sativa subsp. japonica TaxID=39947 RepID=C7IZH4_ORYSJ|nr:Os03g0760401 [Oryza sativa Japonica Group]|eukprot:NP_001173648.1 Os03g0760401 [Oryza sativa Japonica Group]
MDCQFSHVCLCLSRLTAKRPSAQHPFARRSRGHSGLGLPLWHRALAAPRAHWRRRRRKPSIAMSHPHRLVSNLIPKAEYPKSWCLMGHAELANWAFNAYRFTLSPIRSLPWGSCSSSS